MDNTALIGILKQFAGLKSTRTIKIVETEMDISDDFSNYRSHPNDSNSRTFMFEGKKLDFTFNKIIDVRKAFLEGWIHLEGKVFTNSLRFEVPIKQIAGEKISTAWILQQQKD
jgi:hypothetical protein